MQNNFYALTQNIWITWHLPNKLKTQSSGNWKNDAITYFSVEIVRLTTNTVRFVIIDITSGRVAWPLATSRSQKTATSSAIPENGNKIDNCLGKLNFFTLWSSPPLWNTWISRHTTIRCSLVCHPVHCGKLLDRAVIPSCCCHADLKMQFNTFLVNWDFTS